MKTMIPQRRNFANIMAVEYVLKIQNGEIAKCYLWMRDECSHIIGLVTPNLFKVPGQFKRHFLTDLFIWAGRVVNQVQGISQGPVLAAGAYFLCNLDIF